MRLIFLLSILALSGCAGLFTPEAEQMIRDGAVGVGTTLFGPLGGLLADHSIELLLGGWMVQRKLNERKRYQAIVKPRLKPLPADHPVNDP